MANAQGVYLALLFPGILLLVGGLVLTRFHWRSDIAPYGRGTPHLQVLLHPERYTTDAPVGAIRALSLAGATLLAGAVAILAYTLVQTSLRP